MNIKETAVFQEVLCVFKAIFTLRLKLLKITGTCYHNTVRPIRAIGSEIEFMEQLQRIQ